MGCLGSKGIPANEARKNNDNVKENLSKKKNHQYKKGQIMII